MKVAVKVTLDIDPEAWMKIYDVERSEIRADVNQWAFHLLHQAAWGNEVLNNPT